MYYRYKGLDILKNVTSPYPYIKSLNIFLIRHGESECNLLQNNYKSTGKPLTENLKIEDALVKLTALGENQALALGNSLQKYMIEKQISKDNVLILVSPYERTRKTFELANKSLCFNENATNIFVLNSLVEQSFGAFNMISRDVKKEVYGKIYDECNRNTISYFKPTFLGESPFDVCTRLWQAIYFIKEYTQETNVKNVFIFGHGNANKCMLINLLNLPPEIYHELPNISNTSIINIDHGKFYNLQL